MNRLCAMPHPRNICETTVVKRFARFYGGPEHGRVETTMIPMVACLPLIVHTGHGGTYRQAGNIVADGLLVTRYLHVGGVS